MKEIKANHAMLWPQDLLYWRRMGSQDISDYVARTPEDKQMVLVCWGVLEGHGPWLPVANDSLHSAVITDIIAQRLIRERDVKPIIFNSFQDIGAPSATRGFPGSVGYNAYPVQSIQAIWEQTLAQVMHVPGMNGRGIKRVYLINGDGGNWRVHAGQLFWDNPAIQKLIKEGLIFEGSNWDQEGGQPFFHGGTHSHTLIKWMCDFAPEEIRLSALRHGCKAADEKLLQTIDGTDMRWMESEPHVLKDWSALPGQDKLRSVEEFDYKLYRELLYAADGSPLTEGGIAADFEAKMDHLWKRVTGMIDASK